LKPRGINVATGSQESMLTFLIQHWHQLLWSAGILLTTIAVALAARSILLWFLRRLARREGAFLGQWLLKHGERPTGWIFPLLAVLAISPDLPLPPVLKSELEHITGLCLIAATAWLAILLVQIASKFLSRRFRIDVADNLLARRIQTQFQMLRRIVIILVVVVAVAIMLMTFPAIRQIGMSILASAGLASLVVGLAMQSTLSNLIAGVQIAFAQPFRLDDAVVVEGEWGWIEEIGTMYVVVRIWDLRRLVLPLSYFLNHPFQNWTRSNANLLGSCFVFTDYTAPVDAIREELRRVCQSTPLWNGKVCVLQVSDCSERTMQLRALMDARNSSDAWDLRCLVREKLIDFLQRNYPQCLPRVRGEFDSPAAERMFEQAGERFTQR
jgi:small-conductance mechanosensitive channel